jgi:integrative and conjugative element protein (TIGR02256 family)
MGNQLIINIADETIYIPISIIKIWETFRQIDSQSNEACGILIGNQLQDTQVYELEFITTPQKQDIRSKYHFVMKDPFHQQFLEEKYKESNGTSIYLGTWHSHPQHIPIPSSIDIKDWQQCIDRNFNRRLFFIIVGIQEIKIHSFKDDYLHISSVLRF